jgi:signal transduction histidine kinase
MHGSITVVKEYGDIPMLVCHPGKINQVIMNILINAIHALQSRSNNKITINTKFIDNNIVLSIKDNAGGIPKEMLDKIWKPFFTTKDSSSGSGLGLFISYNIVKEHHGTITVNSEKDIGTEFVITLPINKDMT